PLCVFTRRSRAPRAFPSRRSSDLPRWAVGQGPHVLKPVGNSTGTKRVQRRDVSHITGVVLPRTSRGGGVTNPAGGPTEMEAKRGRAWRQARLLGPDALDGACRVEMARTESCAADCVSASSCVPFAEARSVAVTVGWTH